MVGAGKKKWKQELLSVLLTPTSLHTCPYIFIRPASEFGCVTALCWLTDKRVLWYQWIIPTSPLLLLLLCLFYLSPSIASSGLEELAVSTVSEMPALTWPMGRTAGPDTGASIHKVPSLICKSVADLRSRMKKKKLFMLNSILAVLCWRLMIINSSSSTDALCLFYVKRTSCQTPFRMTG